MRPEYDSKIVEHSSSTAGRGLRLQARTAGAENRDLRMVDITGPATGSRHGDRDPGDRAWDADSETPSHDRVRRRQARPAAGPGRTGSLVQLSPSH